MTMLAPASIQSAALSRQNARLASASQWQKTIQNSPAPDASLIFSWSRSESQGQIPLSVAVAIGEQKLGSAQPNTATRTRFRSKRAGAQAVLRFEPPPIGLMPALCKPEIVCLKPRRP